MDGKSQEHSLFETVTFQGSRLLKLVSTMCATTTLSPCQSLHWEWEANGPRGSEGIQGVPMNHMFIFLSICCGSPILRVPATSGLVAFYPHEPGEISQVWPFSDHLHMGGPHQTWEITMILIVSPIQLIPCHITKSFPNNIQVTSVRLQI